VKCVSNLRQIGLAMLMYSNAERNGGLPRTYYDPNTADKPNFFTGYDSADSFGKKSTVKPNDVTAAFFLTLKTQDITPEVFVCPTSHDKRGFVGTAKGVQDVSNFPEGNHLSYSMTNPYASPDAIAAGFKWNNTLSSDFAVV